MPSETTRIQVSLPRPLVATVDQLVGRRQRSAFIVEAAAEKAQQERLGRALETYAGILDPEDHPEWRTPEMTSAWVRKVRSEADAATARKLDRHRP